MAEGGRITFDMRRLAGHDGATGTKDPALKVGVLAWPPRPVAVARASSNKWEVEGWSTAYGLGGIRVGAVELDDHSSEAA